MKTMRELYTFRCAECGRHIQIASNESKKRVDTCPDSVCDSVAYYNVGRADIETTITGEDYGPGLIAPDVEDHIDSVAATYVLYYDDATALSFVADSVIERLDKDVADSLTKTRVEGIVEYIIRTKLTHLDPP